MGKISSLRELTMSPCELILKHCRTGLLFADVNFQIGIPVISCNLHTMKLHPKTLTKRIPLAFYIFTLKYP